MPSSCAVSGSITLPWQPTLIQAAPLAHASSPSSALSHPLDVSAQMHGVGTSASDLNRTLIATFIATTAWTASRDDSGDGCQRGGLERRWDD